MIRKIVLALAAVSAIGTAALSPTAASAGGYYSYGGYSYGHSYGCTYNCYSGYHSYSHYGHGY